MSPNRIPRKPDGYKRGGIYICNLPTQTVTETTDGKVHHRDGVERHGPHPCVVISGTSFNATQARGLIVVPIENADTTGIPQFKVVPSTWVRVITKGEPGYVLVEQLRYIDRSRCKAEIGVLADSDLKQVDDKLKQILHS